MMKSDKRPQSIPDFQSRKPDVNLLEFAGTPMMSEGVRWDSLSDLQHSHEQLRELLSDLRARNQELEAYNHMLAHDLKDPLTIMIAAANLITDVPDLTGEELKECMQQIKYTAYEMNSIINSLLLFAEVSKAEVPVEPVNMAKVVTNVRIRLGTMIKENEAKISIPRAWPHAIGYGPWLEEVWANYISNALKHGGQPPYVELGALAQPDRMIRFWTRDNGLGIPPNELARLFKPFNQIGSVRNLGHGLGLSIARQIVEKLGGHVGVESELGKGSLFFFTLPAGLSS
ncbi:MAG: HAMP domain-containing sensor histidine kinase [Anaerolineales bacterium]